MVKKFILVALLPLSIVINAEYILYKRTGYVSNAFGPSKIEPLTEAEYMQAYKEILVKYQWPMCIASVSTQQEILSFYSKPQECAEELLLRSKLKSLNKTYDLVFVPTAFYELTCIELKDSLGEIRDSLLKYYSANPIDENIISIMNGDKLNNENPLNDIYCFFETLNTNVDALQLRSLINISLFQKGIIQFLEKYSQDRQINNNNEILTFLALRTKILNNDQELRPINQTEIKKIYLAEYRAHWNNVGLLYRGMQDNPELEFLGTVIKPIEYTMTWSIHGKMLENIGNGINKTILDHTIYERYDLMLRKEKNSNMNTAEKLELEKLKHDKKKLKIFDWEKATRSISYGNSFFAGYLRDPWACAYTYVKHYQQGIGYIVNIKKHSYLNGDLQSIFRISPLDTIIALYCGMGQLFHSRSIAGHLGEGNNNIIGLWIGLKVDAIGYIIKDQDPLQLSYKLSDYLARHAQIIALPQSKGGWDVDDKAAVYNEGQKYLSTLLKSMYFLSQNMPQYLKLE